MGAEGPSEPLEGGSHPFCRCRPPTPTALGHRRGEGNEPGPLAQEPGSQRLLPCAMTSPQRRGRGGDHPAGSCGPGWGRAPRPLRPGRCFPAVYFPAESFPLRDSHKRRFLPGQCPMAAAGVPYRLSSVKCSSWHLGSNKTLIQGDILSQVLPSSTYPTPVQVTGINIFSANALKIQLLKTQTN